MRVAHLLKRGGYAGADRQRYNAVGSTCRKGTLKGDVADIFPYASSLWVVMGRRSLLARIRIFSLSMLLQRHYRYQRWYGFASDRAGYSVALNASLFNGDGTLVNATDA